MLLTNQQKVIQQLVTDGQPLPPDLASALYAAFEHSETQQQQSSNLLREERQEKQKLELERSETLRIRSELEATIDQRVDLRTKELNLSLIEANKAVTSWRDRCNMLDAILSDQKRDFKLERQNYQGIILRMRPLLEEKISPRFLTFLTWSKRAKSVLKDAGLDFGEAARSSVNEEADRYQGGR